MINWCGEYAVHYCYHRDALIAQMAQEILELKAKVANLEADLQQGRQLMLSLREQLDKLKKEKIEYQQIAEQACSVSY